MSISRKTVEFNYISFVDIMMGTIGVIVLVILLIVLSTPALTTGGSSKLKGTMLYHLRDRKANLYIVECREGAAEISLSGESIHRFRLPEEKAEASKFFKGVFDGNEAKSDPHPHFDKTLFLLHPSGVGAYLSMMDFMYYSTISLGTIPLEEDEEFIFDAAEKY
jgi:hypothetical protein